VYKPNLEIQKKVEEILKDTDTKDWLATISSESAKINYSKHLAEYLLYRKTNITELVNYFKKDEIGEIKKVQNFVNYMLNEKKLAPGTVANYASVVKNRMQYDGIPFTRNVKIPNRTYHPTVENEVIPTKEQIISFLRNAKHATQSIIALIAFLGFRFNVMADLRVKDLPEMRLTDNQVIFEKIPTRVKVRKELNEKKKKGYETFLIETGCMIIKNSLEIRMKKGEKLDSESLIIPTKCEKTSIRQRSKAIARRLNTVFDKVKYDSRPYSLKNYFATALMNTGIQQNYQTYFMGHKGPVQNVYSVDRKQSTEQIEEMRKLFKEKIEPHLIPQETNADATVRREFKKFAKAVGVEVPEEAGTNETIAEIAEIYNAGKKDISRRKNTQNPFKQKRIIEKEVDKYLEDNWEITHVLQNGNLIVRKTIPA